jgi:hypothetical protein
MTVWFTDNKPLGSLLEPVRSRAAAQALRGTALEALVVPRGHLVHVHADGALTRLTARVDACTHTCPDHTPSSQPSHRISLSPVSQDACCRRAPTMEGTHAPLVPHTVTHVFGVGSCRATQYRIQHAARSLRVQVRGRRGHGLEVKGPLHAGHKAVGTGMRLIPLTSPTPAPTASHRRRDDTRVLGNPSLRVGGDSFGAEVMAYA